MPVTMPFKAKHTVEEINGVRCTVVEKGIDNGRCNFLKDLLEFNKFEVVVAEEPRESESAPQLYTLGVTDLIFSPVVAVYELSLKTRDGKRVSPAYWEQKMAEAVDQYWLTPEETLPGGSAWFYKPE
jgi:hypothetical protein